MPRLSCFIITRDEGDRIEACIRAIQPVVDEIVVVDSGSTDDTVAKAKALGAKTFFRAWDGYGPQKRFAEEQVTSDWVLNLDADEVATEALRAELAALMRSDPPFAAYRLRLITVYPGRTKPRLWADDHNAVRLYDRRLIRYRDSLVYDRPETGDHPVGQLVAGALHYSARSVAHMKAKYESYFALQAKTIKKPAWQLTVRLPLEYPFAFLRSYLARRNFTGGWDGLRVAHIFAFMRTKRIWMMLRQQGARPLTAKTWLAITSAVFAFVVLAAAYVWRADISQAFLDPGVPFQTYRPPAAPDYSKAYAWALIPKTPATWTSAEPAADVFFVHPTTYDGGRDWNGAIDHPGAAKLLARTMLPNYAGPFRKVGRLFAPRYRQASLYTLLTSREDAREARAFAEKDVEAAFRFYLDHYNRGRPLIIAGVEQGGFLAERLAAEAEADVNLSHRLVSVYLIETAVAADAPPAPACTSPTQVGCLVAWISVADGESKATDDRVRHSLIWKGTRAEIIGSHPPLCVNPITGVRDTAASARDHRGGVNASKLEWETQPAFLAHQVAAKCVNGLLQVTRARSQSLRPSGGWVERARVRPYNSFYADLEADAERRTAAMLGQPGFGKLAPPIDKVVEIKSRPLAR